MRAIRSFFLLMDVPWSFGPAAIAAFIVFIGILIFVHELGHFLAAKYFDIKVIKFSLGFGPPLIRFVRGETIYQVAAVPLGGYVRMAGDQPGEDVDPDDRERSFTHAPLYQRAVIALAGPAFNLGFPVLCFFAYNLLGPVVASPVVGQVEIGQPADVAGLRAGDRIVEVDGSRTWSFHRITELISARPGERTSIKVERGGEVIPLEVTPRTIRKNDPFGEAIDWGIIGVVGASHGPGVGVAFPQKNQGGFATGDEVLRVGDTTVERGEEIVPAFAKYAGQTVDVVVARARPSQAGGLLFAVLPEPVALRVPVPATVERLSDLGLDLSQTFLRRIIPGGAAERAGLRSGDQLVEVANRRIRLFWSFILEVRAAGAKPLEVVVRRDGVLKTVMLQSDARDCLQQASKRTVQVWDPGVGLGWEGPTTSCYAMNQRIQLMANYHSAVAPRTETTQLTLAEAFVTSVEQTAQVIGFVGEGIYRLFAGDISTDNVGGPLSLFKYAAQAAEIGIFAYLRMLALISVNLGLINLLPIPIFDGGHLMFIGIEAVKRRPLSLRTREIASLIGVVLIFALFVLAMRNDILNLELF